MSRWARPPGPSRCAARAPCRASTRRPCRRGGPFFVGGQQQRDRARMRRAAADKALGRHHERGDRALHVGAAAAVQPAVAHRRHERIGAPAFARPGGERPSVCPTNANSRSPGARACNTQVVRAVAIEPLHAKAGRGQALGDQRLAAPILRRDGRARDQSLGKIKRGRHAASDVQREFGEGGRVRTRLGRRIRLHDRFAGVVDQPQ